MAEPPFADKTAAPPSRDQIRDVLGSAHRRWAKLEEFALNAYGVEGEPIFFGRDSGWCLRFRRGGKALFTLIPRSGVVHALVVVGPSAWSQAADVNLSPVTRAAWDGAHPYPDGRWLWLDVTDDEIAADIERLVALKSPPPRRRRVAVAV